MKTPWKINSLFNDVDFRKTLSKAQLPFQKCGKYNFAQGQYIDPKALGNIIYVLITKSKLAASQFLILKTSVFWIKLKSQGSFLEPLLFNAFTDKFLSQQLIFKPYILQEERWTFFKVLSNKARHCQKFEPTIRPFIQVLVNEMHKFASATLYASNLWKFLKFKTMS